MMLSIDNAVQATWIFTVIFLVTVLFSIRPKKSVDFLPIELTNELKGLAILAIIFSHVGYFLVNDHRFLFPLSIMAGVGVNLFLFLSAYGLTSSTLKKEYGTFLKRILGFYKQRLTKLFIPLWLTLIVYLFLDFFVLKIVYPWQYITKAFFGYYPSANLFNDLNSPLWYFTLILFYYLIFPIVFSKKRPWVSAIIIYILSLSILRYNPDWMNEVELLYKVHFMAFPLGIIVGWLLFEPNYVGFINFSKEHWLTKFLFRFKKPSILKIFKNKYSRVTYYLTIIITIIFISYFAYYSGVGQSPKKEQFISIVTMLAIIYLFSYKKFEVGLFNLYGIYSYEIYLFHWPLISRYDYLYKYFSPWLATIFYLVIFLGLAWILKMFLLFVLPISKKR